MFGLHGLDLDLPCLQSHFKMKAMIIVSFLWARKVRTDSMLNTSKDTAAFLQKKRYKGRDRTQSPSLNQHEVGGRENRVHIMMWERR